MPVDGSKILPALPRFSVLGRGCLSKQSRKRAPDLNLHAAGSRERSCAGTILGQCGRDIA